MLGGNGEIEQRELLRVLPERLPDKMKEVEVRIITVDIAQKGETKLRETPFRPTLPASAMFLRAPFDQLLQSHRHDGRCRRIITFTWRRADERLQGRKNLLVGEVAGVGRLEDLTSASVSAGTAHRVDGMMSM